MTSPTRTFTIEGLTPYQLEAPLGDHITKQISAGVPYEKRLLEALEVLCAAGLFVDCGAHIGNHTLYLASHGWTGSSFEPNPEMRVLLETNLERNGLSGRVSVFGAALGELEGTGQLKAGDNGNSGSTRLDPEESGETSVVPLDDFGLRPDLVKIDVEGMELAVLRGMVSTLSRSYPVVVVESHGGPKEVARLLRPFGYRRIGGSWCGSPTFIFVARGRHKVRAIRLIPRILFDYGNRLLRSERLRPIRPLLISIRDFPSYVTQRLTARRRRKARLVHSKTNRPAARGVGGAFPRHRTPSESPVVVSMTSFPARISSAWLAIESCFDQSLPADEVIICLSREEFPTGAIPKSLEKYLDFGLHVLWVDDNIRSYKKLIPVRRARPTATIVTVDDDIIYGPDFLSELVELSEESPGAVIGHRGYEVAWGPSGPAPYRNWLAADSSTPPEDLFLTTGGGTLYPPSLRSERHLYDALLATRICPTADDVWFWAANQAFGVRQVCTGSFDGIPVRELVRGPMLHEENVYGGKNDLQISRALAHFASLKRKR